MAEPDLYTRALFEIYATGGQCDPIEQQIVELQDTYPVLFRELQKMKCRVLYEKFNLYNALPKKLSKAKAKAIEGFEWHDYFDKYFRKDMDRTDV